MHSKIPSLSSFVRLCAIGAAVITVRTDAQVLFQDGFNYAAPGNLGANAPWGGGSSTNIAITAGNLAYSGLQNLGGNEVTVNSGVAASSDTNVFSSTTISTGSIYFSFLVNATTAPTANNYLISLNPTASKPSGSADEFSFYTGANGGGWKIGVRTSGGGSGATYESAVLTAGTTYLIVGEYTFASDTASLYLDPVPGGTQPVTPDATQTGTGVAGGIENIGVKAQSTATSGVMILDNFVIGDTWSDVTEVSPAPEPSTLALSAIGLVGLLLVGVTRSRRSQS